MQPFSPCVLKLYIFLPIAKWQHTKAEVVSGTRLQEKPDKSLQMLSALSLHRSLRRTLELRAESESNLITNFIQISVDES
jgi:hypothetical protein